MMINKKNSTIHAGSFLIRSWVLEWHLWKELENQERARS